LSERVRAFLAFDLDSPEVKRKLTEMQRRAARTGADLKSVEAENIHITVRFLGDISLDMVEKVFLEMQKTSFSPFNVKIRGLGVFPNLSCPRVLWAGIAEGTGQLEKVFLQLEPNLQKLGFNPDPKGFNPHLTIARVRSAVNKAELADFVQRNVQVDFGDVKAVCLRLKRSDLTPRGPVYSNLKEYIPKL
jgi:2'-5' RNA ligase